MITIENGVPPPVKFNLAGIIRDLEVDQSAFIPPDTASIDTVRSTVTRVKSEYEGQRDYITAKSGGGVRVWRTA
jgi:hypothetical protein